MEKHNNICQICADEGKTQGDNRVSIIRDKEGDRTLVIFCLVQVQQSFWRIGTESARADIRDFVRLLVKENGAEDGWLCVGGTIVELVKAKVGETEIVPPGSSSNEIEPPGVFDESPTAQCESTPAREKHRWR